MNISQLVFIGFGSVAKATLTILQLKEPELARLPIVIVDKDTNTIVNSDIYNIVRKKVKVTPVIMELTKENYKSFFDKYVLPQSMVIELAYRLGTAQLIEACQEKDSLYLNTALDLFWSDGQFSTQTLAMLKDDAHEFIAKSPVASYKKRVSSLVNHGMNPGLVSHFVKHILSTIVEQMGPGRRKEQLMSYLRQKKFNLIAEELELTLIQIPERDTQYSRKMRSTEEFFCNTWSVVGLLDEAFDEVQISWGTHESKAIRGSHYDKKNCQIISPIWSCQVKTQSYEPEGGEFSGFCIPHAESYSLVNYLKTETYCPSVYYSYLCPDDAKILLQYEFALSDTTSLPEKMHIYRSDEVAEGYDSVGVLCYFRNLDGSHRDRSDPNFTLRTWWCGTTVHNEFARAISPEVNATTVQVGISLCSAIHWMIQNNKKSMIEAEEVDSQFVIDYCEDYLDDFRCMEIPHSEYKPQSDTFYDLSVLPEIFFD